MIGLDDALVATRWGVFLLRTILRFWRGRAIKNIETSKELLDLKEEPMNFRKRGNMGLPVVAFPIFVHKKVYLKLQPQKIMFDLICDSIPLKTISWERNYNIEDLKEEADIEAPDIEAIDDGKIIIRFPCVNVAYNHKNIHKWELKGKVTFNSKIGEITKKGTFPFQLGDEKDRKQEDKLKEAIKYFHKFYVEGVESIES